MQESSADKKKIAEIKTKKMARSIRDMGQGKPGVAIPRDKATVTVERLVGDLFFQEWHKTEEDTLVGVTLGDGSKISVLDRLTGWGSGIRDTETGYREHDSGKFWLASGNFDIRDFPSLSLDEAVKKIKENANTCVGV